MKKFWDFISAPQNLAVLVALGGGLGFLWKEVITHKEPPPTVEAPAAPQTAIATNGTAVIANGASQVNIASTPAAAPAPAQAPKTDKPVARPEQTAQAGPGGTAINASDAARVSVSNGGAPAQ